MPPPGFPKNVVPFDVVHLDLCGLVKEESRRAIRQYACHMVARGGVVIFTFGYGHDVVETFVAHLRGGTLTGAMSPGTIVAIQGDDRQTGFGDERVAGRVAYLTPSTLRLDSVLLYQGNEMPMASVLWVRARAQRWPNPLQVRPEHSFARVEETDVQRAVAKPAELARCYGMPEERVRLIRRTAAAQKAVRTRERQLELALVPPPASIEHAQVALLTQRMVRLEEQNRELADQLKRVSARAAAIGRKQPASKRLPMMVVRALPRHEIFDRLHAQSNRPGTQFSFGGLDGFYQLTKVLIAENGLDIDEAQPWARESAVEAHDLGIPCPFDPASEESVRAWVRGATVEEFSEWYFRGHAFGLTSWCSSDDFAIETRDDSMVVLVYSFEQGLRTAQEEWAELACELDLWDEWSVVAVEVSSSGTCAAEYDGKRYEWEAGDRVPLPLEANWTHRSKGGGLKLAYQKAIEERKRAWEKEPADEEEVTPGVSEMTQNSAPPPP